MIKINDRELMLINDEHSQIFSVKQLENGKIKIQEECDGWFWVELDKKEAINHFKKIIKYIEDK